MSQINIEKVIEELENYQDFKMIMEHNDIVQV